MFEFLVGLHGARYLVRAAKKVPAAPFPRNAQSMYNMQYIGDVANSIQPSLARTLLTLRQAKPKNARGVANDGRSLFGYGVGIPAAVRFGSINNAIGCFR